MSRSSGSPPRQRNTNRIAAMSLKATAHVEREQIEQRVDQLSAPRGIVSELVNLKNNFSTLRGSHRKEIRNQLAVACDLAAFVRDDQGAWIDFCRLDEWRQFKNRPTEAKPTDPLGYVLRYAIGFKGRAATKKVSKYRKALMGFFDDGVPQDQIASRIKEGGGLEKLARSRAKQRKPAAKVPEVKLKYNLRLLDGGSARFSPAFAGSRVSFEVFITRRQESEMVGRITKFKIHPPE